MVKIASKSISCAKVEEDLMKLTTSQEEHLNDLLARTGKISFDYPDAVFTFTDRLARDNGWSTEFAEKVAMEYRRFACLVIASERELTPSDQVDQAWHLHLLYTRNYWGVWANALGRPLHHGPTPGGVVAGKRYWENYEAALALYQQGFREKPPEDVWPHPAIRFDTPGRFVRLDTLKHFIWKRPGSK